MAHVDDGQLNALLDGELAPDAVREVEAHVATCAECARRLEDARAFLAEAGELLAVLTPPPRAADPVRSAAVPPAVAKTSKEIAISVDGRTEMTPAIRPVFKHEVPAAAPRRGWKMPDLEKMAWAASLVLCLGVGYLANEVYHLRQVADSRTDGQTDRRTDGPTDVAANTAAPAERDERRANEPAAGQSSDPSSRLSVSPPGRQAVRPSAPAERAPNAAPARPKPAVTKPAPAFARPRPEQIAGTGQPTAPAALAQPAPAPTAGMALGDRARAAAPPAASAAGAGVRGEGRANALDEVSAGSGDVTARRMLATSFRRATMEEAVRRLSGSIRLIDGMNPSRVELGAGRLVPGADGERDVVRVTYSAGTSRLVLDQQLGEINPGGSINGLMPGDTLVTALGGNGTQVRWLDRKFWLSLTGEMSADSMRALVERIR